MEYEDYNIIPSPSMIGYQIQYVGRGSLPLELRGSFTDRKTASKFIDIYLSRKEEDIGQIVQPSGSKQVQRRVKN